MNKKFSPARVKIAFFGHNVPWAHKIRQELNNSEKTKYPSTSLPKLERSISQKLFNLRTLIDETNLEMININREIRRRKNEVDENIKAGTAFIPEQPFRITKILSFTEASISTIKSICEFLRKYSEDFYKIILGKDKSELLKDLKEKDIQLEWIDDIANIRNDLLHNYAAWLFFQETDTAYTFGLKLPDELRGKKWKGDSLTIDQLNKFFIDFEDSYTKLTDLLVEKIKEKRMNEKS